MEPTYVDSNAESADSAGAAFAAALTIGSRMVVIDLGFSFSFDFGFGSGFVILDGFVTLGEFVTVESFDEVDFDFVDFDTIDPDEIDGNGNKNIATLEIEAGKEIDW